MLFFLTFTSIFQLLNTCDLIPSVGRNRSSLTSDNFEIVDCLKYITDSFVLRSTIILLEDEIQKVPWINNFLGCIEKPRIILARGRNTYDIFGFYILFPEYGHSYIGRFQEKNHITSKFLLVWNSVVPKSSVISVFEGFWRDRRTNVVSLVRIKTGGDLKLYTFFPYTENKCGLVGEPMAIDVWNHSLKRLQRNIDFFEIDSINFMGCTLKVIGNHKPPDNIMRFDNENNRWTASGVSKNILEVAQQHFNFTSEIIATDLKADQKISWYFSTEELDFVCDAVNKETVDLAFGWYSYSSIEMDNLDARVELGSVSSIDCFGWAVPYRAGRRPPNSAYYTMEFKMYTWTLIITTFFITSLLMFIILRKNSMSLFLVIQVCFEHPIIIPRYRTSSFGILFCNFCFYSLVISAAYKASFASFITVSFHGREFTTPRDILESSLNICGSPEMFKVLKAVAVETNLVTRILSRFNTLPPIDFEDVMRRVIRQRDIAVIGIKRNLYYHSIEEAKRLKVKIPFRFIPGCLIRPHTTHFLFKKGSYLIRPFNVLLNRLFESGIISNWILHLGTNKILPTERFKGRVIRLSFFNEIFYLLFIGYVISFMVFIFEIFFWKYKTGISRSKSKKKVRFRLKKISNIENMLR